MPWMTSGETPTAAKFNETAPGIATTAGNLIVTDGANSITERTPTAAYVSTTETTTSTSFTDLTTSGPAVTVTTGTTALVIVTARLYNSAAGNQSQMGYAVSGASTVAASITKALIAAVASTRLIQASAMYLETGLTAGSNTFTAKYAVTAGTGTFLQRRIVVIPL